MLLLTTYNLKPGADTQKFRDWSRDIDMLACLAKPVCHRFETYTIVSDDPSQPTTVVEWVDVTSLEEWNTATSAPDHAAIMTQWNEFAEEDSVVSRVCESVSAA